MFKNDSKSAHYICRVLDNYVNDSLQYLPHEEGRIRYRLDSTDFRLQETRDNLPDNYPNDSYTDPNEWVARCIANEMIIGPAITLKVMAGDQLNVRVSSWYSLQSNPLNTNLALILDDLIDVFAGQASSLGNKATALDLDNQSGFLNDDVFGFLDNGMTSMNSSKPKAALNWILFDEQFKIVNSSSGFEQVGNDEEFKIHQFNGITMNKNGYLFEYVSNANENIPVYFDNLQSLSRTCFG